MVFGNGPPTVVCYICGRQYGSRSIEIHQKNCKEMWIKREKTKPKSERRPVPKPPTEPQAASANAAVESLGGGGMSREEYNAAALETFNNEAMKSCPHCARTFLEDRLVIHLRSCRAGSAARPVGAPRVGGGGGAALNIDPKGGGNEPIRNTTPAQRKPSVSRTGGPARRKPSGGAMANNKSPAKEQSPYSQRTEIPKRPVTMQSGGGKRQSSTGGDKQRQSSTGVSRVEMINMVDDAEDEGLITEEIAAKLQDLMAKDDAMLKNIYLAAKAASGKSVQRFAKNAKRLLEQRTREIGGGSEGKSTPRDRSMSMPIHG